MSTSVRLTNSIRDKIIQDLIDHRFTKEAEELAKKRARFAKKVYNDVYSEYQRRKMNALPDGWLPVKNSVKVKFGSEIDQCYASGELYLPHISRRQFVEVVKGWLVPTCDDGYNVIKKQYEHGDSFTKERNALENAKLELRDKIEETYRNAKAAVYSATTVNKLINAWPEVEPFVRKYIKTEGTSIPAIKVEKLNAMLGLPPESGK